MTLVIDDADQNDLQHLCRLLNTLIETPYTYAEHAYDAGSADQWLRARQSADWPVLVARTQDGIVGLASYAPFRQSRGYRFTVEHSIYVDVESHNHGVAQRLMDTLISRARQQQRHSLIGAIDSENLRALAFHRKFGFVDVGAIPDAGFKLGTRRTLILLQYRL